VRLGESLELPLRERNALLFAAGFAPLYPEWRLDEPLLTPVRRALQHVLDGHQPYPALVMGRYGVLVATNAAFGILTEGVAAELLEPPVNSFRLALHPAGLARRIANLDSWAAHILERLRLEATRNPDDDLWALLGELEGYVREQGAAPPPGDSSALGFAIPMRLRSPHGELNLLATRTTFATALDITVSDLVLEAFLPADEATAANLNKYNH
jgi:hypothetical protein